MRTPGLSDLYLVLDPTVRPRRVTASTQLVIEGFPRSGNTYARAAFEYANGPDVRVSSHLHSLKSIKRGARHGIPTIVLVREPREVLGSVVQFDPALRPGRVLRNYRAFHEKLLRYVDGIVVADFPDVVENFGKVIEICNARYATTFKPYVPPAQSEAAVCQAIDAVAMAHNPSRFGQAVSRPSGERRPAEEALTDLAPADLQLLDEARTAYRELLARGNGSKRESVR